MVERHWPWFRALLVTAIALGWAALAILAGWLVSHLTHALLVLVMAGLIAFGLTPLVNLLTRWLPRPFAIAIAYVAGFSILIGLIGVVMVSAVSEISSLVHQVPVYSHRAKALEPQLANLLSPLGISEPQIAGYREKMAAYLQGLAGTSAKDAIGVVSALLSAVVDAILIVILSVYLTANGAAISRWLRRQTPGEQRHRTRELIAIVNQVVGGYIRGTFLMATLVGVLVGGGMFALRVPYALLLGVVAFFMEFIPILGVFVSGALCLLIALTQGLLPALLVVIYFAVVHVIEGDLVGPRVMGQAVGVHPAVALLALVGGTELFGLWGALFGAPLAGLVQSVATAVWREVRIASPAFPDAPPAPRARTARKASTRPQARE